MKFTSSYLFLLILLIFSVANAGAKITYQGRILRSDSTPVSGSVNFKIQIRSPGIEDCLLYEETKNIALNSNGSYILTVGTGTSTSGLLLLENAISNYGTKSVGAANCTGGASDYTPGITDSRNLKISFDDGTTGGFEDLPTQSVNYAPTAVEAYQIGGYNANNLLRVDDFGVPGIAPILTTANVTELGKIINGTTNQYAKASDLSGFVQTVSGGGAIQSSGGQNPVITIVDASASAKGAMQVGTGLGVSAGTVSVNYGTTAGTSVQGNDSRIVGALPASSIPTNCAIHQTLTYSGGVYVCTDIGINGNQVTAGVIDIARILDGSVTATKLDGTSIGIWGVSSGNAYRMTGNVGIGTSVPAGALDISNGGTSLLIGADSNLTTRTNATAKLGRIAIPAYSNSATPFALAVGVSTASNNTVNVGGGTSILNAATQLLFYTAANQSTTNGTERMRIDANGNVGIGTTSAGAPLDVKGAIRMSGATSGYAGFQPAAVAGSTVWTLPTADGASGQVLSTSGSGVLSWVNSGSGAISSLNGLTAATQTFAIPGTAGTAPNWSSATTIHTLNIPMASTAAVTAGLISKTDFDNFNNKFSATVNSPTAAQVIRYDGSNWVNAAINAATDFSGITPVANGGTGNSSLPSGNLLVGNGTGATANIAAGLAGNVVYATGISAWSSGTPDAANLMDKSSVQTITGAKAFSTNITLNAENEIRFADADSSNYVGFKSAGIVSTNQIWNLPSADGTAGQVLKTDGVGNLNWVAAGGTGDFKADGTVAMTGQLRSMAGTQAAPGLTFTGDLGNGIYAPAANNFAISTNGTEKVRVNSAGNVGLGNNNPAVALDIQNNQNASTTVMIRNTSTGASASSGFAATNNALGSQYIGMGITGTSATPSANNASLATLGASVLTIITQDAAPISFNTSGAERMRILSTGNVGIGTSGPAGRLSVHGNGTEPGGDIYMARSAGTNGPNMTFDASVVGTGGRKYSVSSSTAADSPGAGKFAILDNIASAYRLTIDGSGNVGIGTTAPAATLQVNGTSDQLQFIVRGNSTQTIDLFSLQNSAGSLLAGVTASGGIKARAGSAASPAFFFIADNSTGIYNPSNGIFAITTAASERVRVDATGNLGVGTAAPASKLDVAGDVRVGTTGNACSASNEGAFRYNSVSKSMEFCNGSSWSPMVPSGTMCGQRALTCVGSTLTYDISGSVSTNCIGNTLTVSSCSGGSVSGVTGCPSGYTGRLISSGGSAGIISCAKN